MAFMASSISPNLLDILYSILTIESNPMNTFDKDKIKDQFSEMVHLSEIIKAAHIDDDEINRRKQFLNINEEEASVLMDLAHLILPGGGEKFFVDELYDHIQQFSQIEQILPKDEVFLRFKKNQQANFNSLITDAIDEQYISGRLAIGATHQAIGLETKWHIGTYSWYLCKIIPLLIKLFSDRPEVLTASIKAYIKRIFLDMSLTIDTYNVADQLIINQLKNFAEGIICSMPLGVLVLSRERTIIYANASLESLFDLKHADIIDHKIDKVAALAPMVEDLKSFNLKENKTLTAERTLTIEGAIKSFNIMYSCMIKKQDHLLVIIRDVTQQRESLAKITLFSAVIEQSNEMVVITNSDKNVIYTNSAFEIAMGIQSNEIMGKHFFLFSEPYDEKAYHGLMEKIDQNEVWTGQHTFERHDHHQIYLQTSITPITNSEHDVINYVIISRDISHEKILKDKLREATKMEALGRLVSGIAHNFNNLLAPMMGFTEMAMQNITVNDRVRKDLEEVLKTGERGRDLIQKIFSFARKGNRKVTKILLTEQLDKVLTIIKKTIPANIELVTNIKAKSDQYILAESVDVHQIFSNLCINAIHAMNKQSGQLTVTLNKKKIGRQLAGVYNLSSGNYFQVLVQDTGTGIKEDVIEKMFEPLFTTKASGLGTGLGLYIVHSTVRRLKGDIHVDSKLGVGSGFYVYLPVYEKNQEDDEVTSRNEEKITESIKYQLILLLNTDPVVLKKIGRLLECLEYQVEACLPETGIDLFAKDPERFDLIITENYVNDINIIDTIVKISKNTPLLLCRDEQVIKNEINANIIASIKKPVVPSELARILMSIK